MLNPTYYVYRHVRLDKPEVFYVGKAKCGKTGNRTRRAFETKHRTVYWQNIVAKSKNEFDVEIMMFCDTNEEASRKEIEFIKLYGRASLNAGTLCNLTIGGEGVSCPRSIEWCNAISKGKKDRGNPGPVKKGDKLSEEWRRNISLAAKSSTKRHQQFGTAADNPLSRKVVCRKTGQIYNTIKDAEIQNGLTRYTLRRLLRGEIRNWTSLEFYNG